MGEEHVMKRSKELRGKTARSKGGRRAREQTQEVLKGGSTNYWERSGGLWGELITAS